jgi:hypothetical protein
MTEDMVILSRTFDFVSWLLPRTLDFPRGQRFAVTKRLQDAALDFYERIAEANVGRGASRQESLCAADAALDKVRFYLRLCVDWGWLSPGQHRHVSGMIAEMGRLLGGWRKATASA